MHRKILQCIRFRPQSVRRNARLPFNRRREEESRMEARSLDCHISLKCCISSLGYARHAEQRALRLFARALSFVIHRPPRTHPGHAVGRSPSRAFNECPAGVYFYDASEIRVTRASGGSDVRRDRGEYDGRQRAKTARSDDYDRRIPPFTFTLRHFPHPFLSVDLPSTFLFFSFFFFFFFFFFFARKLLG